MVTATATIRPQPGAQEAFLSSTADITIYGGAAGGGKSYALLLEPLRNIRNPSFGALILRRTTPEITNVGGLWNEAESLYTLMGGEPRIGSLAWRFPSGARIKFDHLEHEKSKFKYQGSQIPLICFDELVHFTEGQFWFMVSRNRSACGVRPYIRATCNPDASSWVARLIDWWIDRDTGYARPDRAGIVRWFVRHGGDLQWENSPDSLRLQYPDLEPKSLTFIPATLKDNPALLQRDPGYLANLQSLPFVERERLLAGNWHVVDLENAEWGPEYFTDIYADWPDQSLVTVVALDPSKGRTNKSDYSAFVAVCKGHDSRFYIDANIARRSTSKIVDDGIAWMKYIRPDAFGCEANGFQELLVDQFRERLHEVHLTDAWLIHGDGNGKLPKKIVRIRSLTPLLAHGRLKFRRSPGTSLLLEQMMAFPLHEHDDGPDALEMAIRLADSLLAGSLYKEHDEVLVA